MSMSQDQNKASSLDFILQDIKNRSESYLSTIYALQAFIFVTKEFCQLEKSEIVASIGRRMHYKLNPKKPPCTPDLVIQLHQREGIVGEAKLLICENKDEKLLY